MSKIKNIDELLMVLKESKPEQKNPQEAIDSIIRRIKADRNDRPVKIIRLLRYASAVAASVILFFFIQQTWYFSSASIIVMHNDIYPAPPVLLKTSRTNSFLTAFQEYINEREKETELKKSILAQYAAANITVPKNIK
ncbi:hypothetical protein [Niabella aquatica]